MVKLSVMQPGTHIVPHTSASNARVRFHLGITAPTHASIRVAEQWLVWGEGRLLIFDDSFEHEVWHNGTAPRLILIADTGHPELSAEVNAKFGMYLDGYLPTPGL